MTKTEYKAYRKQWSLNHPGYFKNRARKIAATKLKKRLYMRKYMRTYKPRPQVSGDFQYVLNLVKNMYGNRVPV